MKTLDVQVPCFNTTFMGMVRGVADSFGLHHSDAALFGASGHAFIIHLHEQLCPSGPYCWNRAPVFRLIQNLGILVQDRGFFGPDTGPEQKADVAQILRREIDAGRPAGLVNMEFQLVTGYDDTGFLTTQPWPGMAFPPGHLNAVTWEELNEVHVNFFTFSRSPLSDPCTALTQSLRFAIGLWDHPGEFAGNGYGMGPRAYVNWRSAVPEHGKSHGNWWNATVWGECRRMASAYCAELKDKLGNPLLDDLAADYAHIADLMLEASDREMSDEPRLERIVRLEKCEASAIEKLRKLLAAL